MYNIQFTVERVKNKRVLYTVCRNTLEYKVDVAALSRGLPFLQGVTLKSPIQGFINETAG